MKRKYEREFRSDEVRQVREKTKIGVIGSGRGAGASFVATSLALKSAEIREQAVAFCELNDGVGGKSWIYDSVGMDKRFVHRNYISLHEMVRRGQYIRNIHNMDLMVNWALCTPGDRGGRESGLHTARLINNIAGDIIVCDFGLLADQELLDDMDIIVAVVDPKPSRLIGARSLYQKIRREQADGRKVIWVINKMNGGVGRKCFADYVRVRDALEIPLIKEVHFYAAEYNCRFPAEEREIRKASDKVFEDIVNKTVI
ncbi:MAG: hypothetical protein ACOX4I_06495 [Anaerovoracaceae bacterium]|jgi:hypothetical protein